MINKLSFEEISNLRKTTEQHKQSKHFPISIMLYNIRSIYNVGTIFRTCDAANIKELILTGYTPSPPRNEIKKTALGATESVTWRYETDIIAAINKQKAQNELIVAVELTNNSKPHNILSSLNVPICLILGNELAGIDNTILEHCDEVIEIPMFGVKHSLNVGVAAGIVIYEAIKTYI
jgi:tRNA G18 (ribose-2'-O)-methylase SpoU